jgi:hypothetical protein
MAETLPPQSLLAVDLGLTTGLALYDHNGHLQWYRSQHYANTATLRRAVHRILGQIPDLTLIYVEGGGPLCAVWEREAEKRQIPVKRVAAETWRRRLLYARDQRCGRQAKRKAGQLARRIIEWSGARRPATALRHDTAESILIGLWGAIDAGWIAGVPAEADV